MAFCCCSCCYCFHSPSNQSLQQVQEMNAKPFQRPQWCQSPYWIVCLQEGICPAQLAFTFTKLSNVMEMVAVNRLLIELAIREPKATEADWKCGVLCLRQDQRQNWGAWSQVLAQLVLFALEEHSFLSHYHKYSSPRCSFFITKKQWQKTHSAFSPCWFSNVISGKVTVLPNGKKKSAQMPLLNPCCFNFPTYPFSKLLSVHQLHHGSCKD